MLQVFYPILNGGTGTSTPSMVPGTNITVSGTWPNQTINSTGGSVAGSNTYVQYNSSGAFAGDSAFRWKATGFNASSKLYNGLRLRPYVSAVANNDTIVGVDINPLLDTASKTGVTSIALRVPNISISGQSKFTQGSIYKDVNYGLTFGGVAGGTSDLLFTDRTGTIQ